MLRLYRPQCAAGHHPPAVSQLRSTVVPYPPRQGQCQDAQFSATPGTHILCQEALAILVPIPAQRQAYDYEYSLDKAGGLCLRPRN